MLVLEVPIWFRWKYYKNSDLKQYKNWYLVWDQDLLSVKFNHSFTTLQSFEKLLLLLQDKIWVSGLKYDINIKKLLVVLVALRSWLILYERWCEPLRLWWLKQTFSLVFTSDLVHKKVPKRVRLVRYFLSKGDNLILTRIMAYQFGFLLSDIL